MDNNNIQDNPFTLTAGELEEIFSLAEAIATTMTEQDVWSLITSLSSPSPPPPPSPSSNSSGPDPETAFLPRTKDLFKILDEVLGSSSAESNTDSPAPAKTEKIDLWKLLGGILGTAANESACLGRIARFITEDFITMKAAVNAGDRPSRVAECWEGFEGDLLLMLLFRNLLPLDKLEAEAKAGTKFENAFNNIAEDLIGRCEAEAGKASTSASAEPRSEMDDLWEAMKDEIVPGTGTTLEDVWKVVEADIDAWAAALVAARSRSAADGENSKEE